MNNSVTIISFSSRQNGNCASISKYLTEYYLQTNVYTIDDTEFAACGKCDYECLKQDEVCPRLTSKQTQIMDAVCDSHLVYFIIPNYCGFPCANYFAFNERSVGYFGMDQDKLERYLNVPKRFIIVSNTEGFEEAMQQQTNGTPDILYLKSRKYGKRSTDGDILDAAEAQADLHTFLSRNDS